MCTSVRRTAAWRLLCSARAVPGSHLYDERDEWVPTSLRPHLAAAGHAAQSPLGAARGCRGWACQRLCAANNFDQSVPRGRICRQQILCTGVNCPCGTGASAADPAPTTSHRVAAWILNRRWIPPHRRRRKNLILCASKGPEAVLEGLSWPIGRSVSIPAQPDT